MTGVTVHSVPPFIYTVLFPLGIYPKVGYSILGCFTLMFQAITGVDAISSLAGPIFRAAGLDSGTSSGLLASLSVGVITTFFTFLSLFVVDRFG